MQNNAIAIPDFLEPYQLAIIIGNIYSSSMAMPVLTNAEVTVNKSEMTTERQKMYLAGFLFSIDRSGFTLSPAFHD